MNTLITNNNLRINNNKNPMKGDSRNTPMDNREKISNIYVQGVGDIFYFDDDVIPIGIRRPNNDVLWYGRNDQLLGIARNDGEVFILHPNGEPSLLYNPSQHSVMLFDTCGKPIEMILSDDHTVLKIDHENRAVKLTTDRIDGWVVLEDSYYERIMHLNE